MNLDNTLSQIEKKNKLKLKKAQQFAQLKQVSAMAANDMELANSIIVPDKLPEMEPAIIKPVLADIADAIREKSGLVEPIRPIEFADEIRALQTIPQDFEIEQGYFEFPAGSYDLANLPHGIYKAVAKYIGTGTANLEFVTLKTGLSGRTINFSGSSISPGGEGDGMVHLINGNNNNSIINSEIILNARGIYFNRMYSPYGIYGSSFGSTKTITVPSNYELYLTRLDGGKIARYVVNNYTVEEDPNNKTIWEFGAGTQDLSVLPIGTYGLELYNLSDNTTNTHVTLESSGWSGRWTTFNGSTYGGGTSTDVTMMSINSRNTTNKILRNILIKNDIGIISDHDRYTDGVLVKHTAYKNSFTLNVPSGYRIVLTKQDATIGKVLIKREIEDPYQNGRNIFLQSSGLSGNYTGNWISIGNIPAQLNGTCHIHISTGQGPNSGGQHMCSFAIVNGNVTCNQWTRNATYDYWGRNPSKGNVRIENGVLGFNPLDSFSSTSATIYVIANITY